MDPSASADEIADLLLQMTREPWPTTDDERLAWFAQLGLEDRGEPWEEPPGECRRFDTALAGVSGSSSMFREEFLGLSLFCFSEPEADGAAAREGYARLRELLGTALGDPDEEWGTPTEPAAVWFSGPLQLELYCFQTKPSSVMVGPSHTARSRAHDAAAASS